MKPTITGIRMNINTNKEITPQKENGQKGVSRELEKNS